MNPTYMALHITNPDVEKEVRELALQRGLSITDLIGTAVGEFKRRNPPAVKLKPSSEEIMAMVRSYDLQPINEDLTDDEILGYGPDGIPE
jgi:hypothetical protein